MKEFSCCDVVPGCPHVICVDDEEELFEQISVHAREEHGMDEVPPEVTDTIRPGVVSIPHGWGHDVDGVQLSVASTIGAGVNNNLLADPSQFDALSGNAVLNGIPITLEPLICA